MPVYKDQTGRMVAISNTPRRIISLVPSQTELLASLGLEHEVVGITKFCVHPEAWFRSKTKTGGTKTLKMEIIHQLQPDLILANKEENTKEQIEELAKLYPVWVSDVNNPGEAYEMIDQIGLIVDKVQAANEMLFQIKENFARFTFSNPKAGYELPAAYLIWQNPYMTVGGDTFIHSMMEAAGFKNIYAGRKRYPEIKLTDLLADGCQFLLLSSEPFPFSETHKEEIETVLNSIHSGFHGRILLVDGEMFSWYGSRMLKAPAYFKQIHDQLK